MIKSKDYHDYVIKDGKFIGAFEEMYQNVDDPWQHGQARDISYDMVLYLIARHKNKICRKGGKILDIGCGKGAFTSRVKKQCKKAYILAIDISFTAIEKAKKKYRRLNIDFRALDIQKKYRDIHGKFDLIIASDIMWYILPNFGKILNHLKKNLKKNGFLLIKQTFCKSGDQKYGKEYVSSVEDMISLLKYQAVETIETNRQKNHLAIILFKI